MNGKKPNSLKELRSLREAVLAEEKAKAKAMIETLPPNELAEPLDESPAPSMSAVENEIENEVEPAEARDPLSDPAIVPLPEPASELSTPSDPGQSPTAEVVQVQHAPVGASRSVPQTPPPRAKIGTKDPALIIPLTPKIKERLQRHVEQSRWSPADLVIELVRSTLHRGYPVIQYGDQILARAGTYRTIERNPFESVLKIVSGQGVFNTSVRRESHEYQRWTAYFQTHTSPDVEHSAVQLCLFELQRYLEAVDDFTVEGWTKSIDPESFIVEALT